jgi:aspartate racemase
MQPLPEPATTVQLDDFRCNAKFALAMCHENRHCQAMHSIPRRRLIGILGGMGPAATIDFMAKVLMLTPARTDQDHVPLLVHDVPQIPDRSAAIMAGSDAPFLPMVAGIMQLERAGAEFIAIPCNTAHFWHDRLASACRVPLLHIADAVTGMVMEMEPPVGALALMATRGTVDAGLYQARFAAGPIRLMLPDTAVQDLISQSIAATKAGQRDVAQDLAEAAGQRLLDDGAERLLLACTELPLALSASTLLPLCIDPTEALARACVKASFGTVQQDISLAGVL